MYNKIVIVGRLVRDPILRRTQNGIAVFTESVAVNDRPKQGGNYEDIETTFIDVVFWDKTAENVAKYQKKGSLLFIEGVLEQRRYTNHVGENRTTYEVIADRVLFLEPKPAETQDSDENTKAPEQQPVPNSDNSDKMAEYDDLPF